VSHNLCLVVYTNKGARSGKQVAVEVPLIQTPTEVTFKILSSGNPLNSYKKWVRARFNDPVLNQFVKEVYATLLKYKGCRCEFYSN
jgi:hypothetical protein